jgi:hypothetical protein
MRRCTGSLLSFDTRFVIAALLQKSQRAPSKPIFIGFSVKIEICFKNYRR